MKRMGWLLTVAVVAVGCGGQGVTDPLPQGGEGDGGAQGILPYDPVVDFRSLIDNLNRVSGSVRESGVVGQPYLTVEGRIVEVAGERVQAYEYATARDAQREAGAVPPSGLPDGWVTIAPVIPPTGYQVGRLLVIGENPSRGLRATLDALLGAPFLAPEGDKVGMIDLDFRGLAQGVSASVGPERPMVVVATNADEAAKLASLVDAETAARFDGFDFTQGSIVAALRGTSVTAGYDIRIEGVETDGKTVRVTVKLGAPEPDGIVAQVITYPYDIVTVAAGSVPSDAAWAMVTVDGERVGLGNIAAM